MLRSRELGFDEPPMTPMTMDAGISHEASWPVEAGFGLRGSGAEETRSGLYGGGSSVGL